jgi:hypothetical protein
MEIVRHEARPTPRHGLALQRREHRQVRGGRTMGGGEQSSSAVKGGCRGGGKSSVGYQGIRWTRIFTWFGPPKRNTLRPRVKGVVLLCLSARMRSFLFSPSVRACGVRLSPVTVVCPDLL